MRFFLEKKEKNCNFARNNWNKDEGNNGESLIA